MTAPDTGVCEASGISKFEYEANVTCPCGGALSEAAGVRTKAHSWGDVRFVRCAGCGSWSQSPRIAMRSLAAWYDSRAYQAGSGSGEGAYLDYADGERQRVTEAAARVARDLAPLLPRGSRVLEIGCATGSMIAALAEAGHDAVGVDLSPGFVRQAKALYPQLDIRAGHFEDVALGERSFDAILMLGTISNLQEHHHHLVRMARLLRPRGLLYFNVPVADSLIAGVYGARYWMFAPSVCSLLSRAGCEAMLRRASYEVVCVRGDRQRPTVSKLLGHMQLKRLYPLAKALGVATWAPPLSLPIPGVLVFWARSSPAPS